MSRRNEGRKSRAREEREGRSSGDCVGARGGKGAMEEEVQERDGREAVCGAAGGRPSYTANPRQPHSITMLSRIQMTVISFGTPYI